MTDEGEIVAIQEQGEVISGKLHKKETTANHAVVSFFMFTNFLIDGNGISPENVMS